MKRRKHLWLSIGGLIAALTIIYLFQKSESFSVKNHSFIMQRLQKSQTQNSEINQDVLKSRNLLLPNYDLLVLHQDSLTDSCRLLKEGDTAMDLEPSPDLDVAVDSYCEYVSLKLDAIEDFKSKNAVVRNSILYISKQAPLVSKASLGLDHQILVENLIRYSYQYYFSPSEDSYQILNSAYEQAIQIKRLNGNLDLPFLAAHVKSILENTKDLNETVAFIISPDGTAKIDHLIGSYLNAYQGSLKSSQKYKLLLAVADLSLIFFVIINVLRLWKSGENLADANLHLEKRVHERTSELENSLVLISEQQQALVMAAKMSELGTMAGGVAHEVNTPLAVLSMTTDILLKKCEKENIDPVFLTKSIKTMQKTVGRIAKIVEGLVRFSRDGSKDPVIHASMKEIVQDTVGLCQEKFKINDVDLKIIFPDQDLFVTCRPVEISQVILNLLNNSYDAIQDRKEKWIHLEAQELDSEILISVTDCGSGIQKELRDKIFRPFFSTKEVGKGTGLGLSISIGLMASQGGSLTYDDHCPNTRFVVRIKKRPSLDLQKLAA